jgi:ParB family chromosome partitioning protein
MEKKALGKGISALIPEANTEEKGRKIIFVNLDQIKPSSLQPREDFNNQQMEELTQSIKEKGVIQPILVRRKGEHYEIIAGERRYRASKLLNLQELPVIIKDADDCDSLELSLIENIQRQRLNPIEEAYAYQYLINKFNVSQEKISEVVGRARVSIANTLRLLKLPQEIQEEMKKGRISFAHGRSLLEIEDASQQRRLAQQVITNGLSVRELENVIKRLRPKVTIAQAKTPLQEPYLAVLEEELQRILTTKVKINKKKKRGFIQIEFYSKEDLERIVHKLRGE